MRTTRPNPARPHRTRAARVAGLLLRALLGARYGATEGRRAWFIGLAARIALVDARGLGAWAEGRTV